MANFLNELGLAELIDDEETARGFLGDVFSSGKVIPNYYGYPYVNKHYGSTQIIARTAPNEDADGLKLAGFDTHADSMCVWEFRIEKKMTNPDEDDPTRVRLFTKALDGSCPLIIDVVNGDILPSFKTDEIIKLQMIAFSDHAEFYADEEEYAESVKPGHNGRKIMIGENTIFPSGLFTDNEEIKDVVQIHGIIKRLTIGTSQFGENEINSNLRCLVETQRGDIVVVFSPERDEVKKNPNMRVGKVIDCLARLSGDAAIYEYESGLIKNAENNLKLVAYTFEDGDPERLRSVLADHFVYHSENTGKHIENVDELIALMKEVHRDGVPSHTVYATIASIDEGDDTLEYPVGTRCCVIRYEDEEGFNAIIIVDTDENGKITRIYLSKNSRYHFRTDTPPENRTNLSEDIAKTTYKYSMIGRAHTYGIIDEETDTKEIEQFINDHEEELADMVSDLSVAEISKEALAEAFLRGIKESGIPHDEQDLREIGQQFHNDLTMFRKEEEYKDNYIPALKLAVALGWLYIGRLD